MALRQNQIIPDTATGQLHNGASIHGNGLNGGPGNITQQQTLLPWHWNSDEAYINGPDLLTARQVKDIVNEMSNDQLWMDQTYNEEHPDAPRSDIRVGMFPNRPDRQFQSDYPNEEDADFLYNNPEYKGIEDYFYDHGALGWLEQRPFSDADRDSLARTFNLMQGVNDYNRNQHLMQEKADMLKRNLYGDTLMDLLESTPEGQTVLAQAHRPKPTARERHITGSAKW